MWGYVIRVLVFDHQIGWTVDGFYYLHDNALHQSIESTVLVSLALLSFDVDTIVWRIFDFIL